MTSTKPNTTMYNQQLLITFFAGFFLFFCTSTFAQRGWTNKIISSIDLMVGGDMGFRLISGEGPELSQQQQNRDLLEGHRLNYRFGLNYNHGVNRNLLAKVGVRFANPGLTVGAVRDFDIHQPLNDIRKVAEREGTEYHYKYQIIEIPLGFRYVLSGAACEPYVEMSASANFYRNTIIEERPYEGVARRHTITEDIKEVYFTGNLAFGGDFTISRRLSGYTQMVARYQLDTLRKAALSEKIISLGLETGVRYYLR